MGLFGRRGKDAVPEVEAADLEPQPGDLDHPLLPVMTGFYVGTTRAEDWSNPVVMAGLERPGPCRVTLTGTALTIERQNDVALSWSSLTLDWSGTAPSLAGQDGGPAGVLVVRWMDPEANRYDSGIRADDPGVYPAWIAAIEKVANTW